MPTDKRVIELFKGANPVPDPERLPEAQLNADALLASGELEPMMAVDPRQGPGRTWRAVAAVAAMAGTAAVVAVTLLFVGGGDPAPDDDTVAAETTAAVTPSTSAPTPTQPVDQPADLSALQHMVDSYHEAYNSGDTAAARELISPQSPVALHPNLEFWIESLGEQVTAECVPSVDVQNGLTCVERYRDQLHGPAGETIRATFHYIDRDGLLVRIHDRFEFRLSECLDFRCPGDAVDNVGIDIIWSYEMLEADLFSWLEQSYPEVAQLIGEPANLGYSAGKPEAVAAALPFVDEFVAQSETWPRVSGHRDLAGMSVLEAVLAEHEAFNSHDPEAFEAWYGRPPDDFVAWWWGLDTRYASECETTDNPAIVQCTSRHVDGFYSKAGAVFEQTQLWTTSGNELILLHTAGLRSEWAYWEFRVDMGTWMKEAYPDVVDQVFAGSWIIHNGEAAVIAMDHIGEFIEQSTEYPRADATEQMDEMITVALFTE